MKGIKWNYSIYSFLSRKYSTLEACCLTRGRNQFLSSECPKEHQCWRQSLPISGKIGLWSLFWDRTAFNSYQVSVQKNTNAEDKVCRYQARLVYGFSFISGCFVSTGIKEIKWNDSICSFLSRGKLDLGSLLPDSWEEAISIKWVSQRTLMVKTKCADVWQDWSMESLLRPTPSLFQDAFSALES